MGMLIGIKNSVGFRFWSSVLLNGFIINQLLLINDLIEYELYPLLELALL